MARRLLCEVHEEYATNIALAMNGYWVYDFALPLLILHAFTFKTMDNLKHWLTICPRRQITVLDTHDGMGIDDIAGLAEVCMSTPSQRFSWQLLQLIRWSFFGGHFLACSVMASFLEWHTCRGLPQFTMIPFIGHPSLPCPQCQDISSLQRCMCAEDHPEKELQHYLGCAFILQCFCKSSRSPATLTAR